MFNSDRGRVSQHKCNKNNKNEKSSEISPKRAVVKDRRVLVTQWLPSEDVSITEVTLINADVYIFVRCFVNFFFYCVIRLGSLMIYE